MSALGGLLTLAKLALPELNAITAVGALATLGGAGAVMDTGVLVSIMTNRIVYHGRDVTFSNQAPST